MMPISAGQAGSTVPEKKAHNSRIFFVYYATLYKARLQKRAFSFYILYVF